MTIILNDSHDTNIQDMLVNYYPFVSSFFSRLGMNFGQKFWSIQVIYSHGSGVTMNGTPKIVLLFQIASNVLIVHMISLPAQPHLRKSFMSKYNGTYMCISTT